jgi:predicted esterase
VERVKRRRAAAALVLALAAPPPPSPSVAPLPRGEVVLKIVCAADPTVSYALYLPKVYTAERKWPVIYVFDSRGIPMGREMIELFRAGAERYGWVVASANESTTLGAMDANIQRMRAMWVDTHARLALDDRRVYGYGFSGLSRTVVTLALAAPGTFHGIIGAQGGFPGARPPAAKEQALPFFGTVGDRDFNYYELLELDARLEELGVPHRIEVFDGSHEWPPEELVTLGMGWLELLAMRDGRRAPDAALVEPLWSADLAKAREHEVAGRLWAAWRAYKALAADYRGLRDTADPERKAAALGKSEALQRDLRERARRDQRDREALARAPAVFEAAGLEPRPGGVQKLLADLDVPQLQARKAASDADERKSAERVLYAHYMQAGIYLPRAAMEAGQWDRAILYLQTAAAINPESPRIPYRLATAYAGKGDREAALAALAKAVEMKGTNLEEIESDPALAALRGEAAYRALAAKLRAQPPPSRR